MAVHRHFHPMVGSWRSNNYDLEKKNISVCAPMAFDTFLTSMDVERVQKDVYKNPYLEFRVTRKDHDVRYEDTKALIIELLDFAKRNRLD